MSLYYRKKAKKLASLKNFCDVEKKVLRGRENIVKGMILYESGRHDDAEKEFKMALEDLQTAPNIPLTIEEWTYNGIVCHRLERDHDAINCYDESIHMDRQYYYAWYNKAISFQSLGN